MIINCRKIQEDVYYLLKNITIKEIMNKYPDKVMKKGVIDRERDTVLILDTCKIIIRKKTMEIANDFQSERQRDDEWI